VSDLISYYLRIPNAYCQWLGGLRWSYTQEVIQYEDVGTFVFCAEIAQFLEGFTSSRPLIHFGFVLHLLHLLGYGKLSPPAEALPLRQAFNGAGRPTRNAGALCAMLCRDITAVAGALNAVAVCRHLSSTASMPLGYLSWYVDPFTGSVEEPPLGPAAFENAVLVELRKFRPGDLRHWMRHGCGFVPDAGERIVRELTAVKPRTLDGVLADLAQNARLAGALPYVAQLVSALTLPPRRWDDQELPTGGYADVVTRGEPERILPSQFALDELEFIRRFAANELLYFRCEEPHVRTREKLVVVLDQGVRTWGLVRLLLSAATLAFGKLAARKGLPLFLAATSSPGRLLDPLHAQDQEIGELVEASDLSRNPGLALERVLEERAEGARDVVLLTHPRNLAEPDVAAAARRAGRGTRLFGVTVDPRGRMQVAEVKRGTPVKLAELQIDLSPATKPVAAPPPRVTATSGASLAVWQGDVEPIPYPFRFGVTGRLSESRFDFDHAGEWVLALGQNGMLHASKIDGSVAEMLPRPMYRGALILQIEAILGVAGGFVVVGHTGRQVTATHYDFGTRTCKTHILVPMAGSKPLPQFYSYSRNYHTVVARGPLTWAVDLATGQRDVYPHDHEGISRAVQACIEAQNHEYPPPQIYVVPPHGPRPNKGTTLELDEATGTLILEGVHPPWPPFVPRADGKPMLQGCKLVHARYRAATLAITCLRRGQPNHATVRVLLGPQGVPLCEYRHLASFNAFTLSCDGRQLAKLSADGRMLHVHDLTKGGGLTFVTPKGKYHQRLEVELGTDWITVRIGKSTHLFDWSSGTLVLRHGFLDLADTYIRTAPRVARKGGAANLTAYDPRRFYAGVQGDVSVVVDEFGQLVVFDCDNRLVCMFYVYRHQVAAWMPDGTRYGPARFSGGPDTPAALEKIGSALRAACARAKEKMI
jgi:hypothetical protein